MKTLLCVQPCMMNCDLFFKGGFLHFFFQSRNILTVKEIAFIGNCQCWAKLSMEHSSK